MATTDGPATQRIIERNRANAQFSTGPRTLAGKARSSRNAVKHGLTANPAVGIVEDRAKFARLEADLRAHLKPRNILEARLVGRIAVNLWRLERAVNVEASAASRAVVRSGSEYELVQRWIERILERWKPRLREIFDLDARGRRTSKFPSRRVWEQPGLHTLDEWRDSEVMADPMGIEAMRVLLKQLFHQLHEQECLFTSEHLEQLLWLLGEPAYRVVIGDGPAQPPPDAPPDWDPRSPLRRLIAEAKDRPRGAPLPTGLRGMVRRRLDELAAKRSACAATADREYWDHERQCAALLKSSALERLMRYETHAERSLTRALDLLAKMRGQRVETLTASLAKCLPDGTEVQLEAARTRVDGMAG